MVGKKPFNKNNERWQKIMGTRILLQGLHTIVLGDFYQMAAVRDIHFQG